ncbi:MAG: aminotransferase class V-fold PLP-dependent enzyme, partial [Pseudomonadota bacterium]
MYDLQTARDLDAADSLSRFREQFDLPADVVYLDGNSLGSLPVACRQRLINLIDREWGHDLIRSWNSANWIDLPVTVGEKIAPLIGAAPGQVVCADSTSVNLFKLLASALQLKPGRSVVLSEARNFPTDLYMGEGLAQLLGEERCELRTVAREDMESALSPDIAVLMLTHVDFRSGRLHDMQRLTALAHERGALVLWDLAHSAGVLPLELDAWGVDMAVGCGYKFLNGGPGAPAFLYLASHLQAQARQPLSGWMGHRRAFEL